MKLVIYIVDDQKDAAEAVARFLRLKGHQVTLETNAPRALEVLLSNMEIDAIVLDIVMPDMLGSQIYETCEAQAPARCERIIFLTGYAEMAPTWIRQTGRIVLEKPADVPRIIRAIEEIGKLTTPRGPHFPTRPRSHPELPPMEAEQMDKEISKVSALAQSGDVIALKLQDHNKRLDTLESHFAPKGMVTEIRDDVKVGKAWIKSIPVVLGCLSILMGALWWFIHQAEREHDAPLLQKAAESAPNK